MGKRAASGFTLFELVLVVCLVGIFFAVALERLLRYQEIAEKTVMERTIHVLRSALALQFAARISGGGPAEAARLAEENPMEWLEERPSNDLGALFAPAEADISRGSWYFDRNARELVYRPNLTRFFISGADGKAQIRFRTVVRLGPGADAQTTVGQRELSELTLRPTQPYRWVPEW